MTSKSGAITYAISNQKGGVGKTITSINLSVALNLLGKKVLCVDLDPQSNCTRILSDEDTKIEFHISDLFDRYIAREPFPSKDECIYKSKEGIYYIPSCVNLSGALISLVNATFRELALKQILNHYKSDFDYIIIDCRPGFDLLTLNAYNAVDEIIIPVQSNDDFALDGLDDLLQNIKMVQEFTNPDLKIAGVLLTKYISNTNIAKLVCETVESYSDAINVFDTKISQATKVAETPRAGKSIFSYCPKAKAAEEYLNLAKELI